MVGDKGSRNKTKVPVGSGYWFRILIQVPDTIQGSGHFTGFMILYRFRILYRVQDTSQGSEYFTGFRILYRV